MMWASELRACQKIPPSRQDAELSLRMPNHRLPRSLHPRKERPAHPWLGMEVLPLLSTLLRLSLLFLVMFVGLKKKKINKNPFIILLLCGLLACLLELWA